MPDWLNKILLITLTFVTSIVCPVTMAQIPMFEVEYKLFILGAKVAIISANYNIDDDNKASFNAIYQPRGVIAMLLAGSKSEVNSHTLWQEEGIVPLEWSIVYDESPNDNLHLQFDDLSVKVTEGNESYTLDIPPKTHHLVSLHLQLAHDIKDDTELLFYDVVTDSGKLRRYVFSKLGDEILETDLGDLKTIKFSQLKKGKLRAYYWISPAHHNLPVRMEKINSKGKVVFAIEAKSLQFK